MHSDTSKPTVHIYAGVASLRTPVPLSRAALICGAIEHIRNPIPLNQFIIGGPQRGIFQFFGEAYGALFTRARAMKGIIVGARD